MITAGIDAGSRTTKAILWDAERCQVLASGVADQTVDPAGLAQRLFARLLDEAKLERDDVACTVATGYGRNVVRFADRTVTEITCHAAGIRRVMPGVRTFIEIGGQDSKVVHLDAKGAVRHFAMNDRCAAGSGRFLEAAAVQLGGSIEEFGALAARCETHAVISSMCVVFAETEIIGLLSSGVPAADIASGVQAAIAARIAGMFRETEDLPIAFTGGVALVPGMAAALEAALQTPIHVAPDPLMTGALGAALIAV